MTVIEGRRTLHPVCPVDRLTPDRGVAALVDGTPVAVFLLATGELFAVDNVDPVTGASVISRGIIGDADGEPTVASPLYKQRYALRSGRCLDADDVALTAHEAVLHDGVVHVALTR